MVMPLNVLIVVQKGRLAFEAILAANSFVAERGERLWLAEPKPGPLWPDDPRIDDPAIREELARHGRFLPFESREFGARYPHGNKIEALAALPPEEPFVFFDTDTLFRAPLPALDVGRPAASLRRTASWPRLLEDGPTRREIWKSLYERFGVGLREDDRYAEEDWRRFPYYNAGWFFGPSAGRFAERFCAIASAIANEPGAMLAGQSLDPWLDQVALPLVIAAEGGEPREVPGLDGDVTCHWRTLPLAYARESDMVITEIERIAAIPRIKKLLKRYPPFHRMLYRGGGAEVRALFADGVPEDEAVIRKRLRAADLWLR